MLGTIALFTGIGAPLFVLAVANFAITAGLYFTETPNPQTGQTMSLLDVGVSAVGVVMGSAGFLRNLKGVNGMRLFTREAVVANGAGGRFVSSATGALKPGALSTFRTNLGYLNQIRTAPASAHRAMQELATFIKGVSYYGANGYRANGLVRTAMNADVVFSTVWQTRGVAAGIQNFVPGATPPAPWHQTTGSKGLSGTLGTLKSDFSGFNYVNGAGNFGQQGTPMFGGTPPPTRQQVLQVGQQLRQSPDIQIIPATP